MIPEPNHKSSADMLKALTRRHFFSQCGMGLGSVALASLMDEKVQAASKPADPFAPRMPHYVPRAKNVIFLFMAGGPSQLEL
ncbi:MAG: sulfatase, partial [Verrucomicrobiota bacterium]|nr:sulfatase [Verrucomicrobiota bacterium]